MEGEVAICCSFRSRCVRETTGDRCSRVGVRSCGELPAGSPQVSGVIFRKALSTRSSKAAWSYGLLLLLAVGCRVVGVGTLVVWCSLLRCSLLYGCC